MDPFLSKQVLMAPARTIINLFLLNGNQGSTEGRTHDSNKADFRQSPIRTDLAIAQLQENAACGQCDKTCIRKSNIGHLCVKIWSGG